MTSTTTMNSILTCPPHQDIKTASSQACYKCHVITTATNHHHGRQMGGQDSSQAPHVCFFFSFFQNFFYTNVNFLIKWTTSSYATTNSSTLTSRPHKYGTRTAQKMPKWQFTPLFAPQLTMNGGSRPVSSPHVCFFPVLFLFFLY